MKAGTQHYAGFNTCTTHLPCPSVLRTPLNKDRYSGGLLSRQSVLLFLPNKHQSIYHFFAHKTQHSHSVRTLIRPLLVVKLGSSLSLEEHPSVIFLLPPSWFLKKTIEYLVLATPPIPPFSFSRVFFLFSSWVFARGSLNGRPTNSRDNLSTVTLTIFDVVK